MTTYGYVFDLDKLSPQQIWEFLDFKQISRNDVFKINELFNVNGIHNAYVVYLDNPHNFVNKTVDQLYNGILLLRGRPQFIQPQD